MDYIKQNYLVLIVIALLVASFFFNSTGSVLGAATPNLSTISNPWSFTNTNSPGGVLIASTTITSLKTGNTGTYFTRMNGGTCYIRPYAATIAATTTAKVDCQGTAAWSASSMSALPGVTVNDNVVLTLSTTTAGTVTNGIIATGASASTTAGYIELTISNATGATYTWPVTGVASGTAGYIIVK